jgi:hypothetical protein
MPVVFKDIGKGAKDLLGKKYDFVHEIKTAHKTDGMTLEAGTKACSKGMSSSAKFAMKDKSWGEIEKTFKTCGSVDGKIKLTQLMPGATVSISGDQNYKFKLEADYKADAFTLQADIDTDTKAAIQASANVMSGLVAGCKAEVCCGELKDYNFGLQYGYSKDLTVACVTSKGRSVVSVSALNKLSCCSSFALTSNYNMAKSSGCMAAGYEKKIDDSTTVKCKLNSCGVISTALEQKFPDVPVKVNVAAEFEPLNAVTKNFGMGLVFGDY